MKTIYSKIAGVSFDNRQQYIKDLKVGDRLKVIRFQNIAGFQNSLALFDDRQIGFIKKELADNFATLIDYGIIPEVYVSAITGGENGYYYGVNIKIVINYDTEEDIAARERFERHIQEKHNESVAPPNNRSCSDKKEELSRLKTAAESGKSYAMYQLGKYYYTNFNNRDYNKALFWLEKSAQLGETSAMRMLIDIYEDGNEYNDSKGHIVLSNSIQERRWRLSLAEAEGDSKQLERLKAAEEEDNKENRGWRNWILAMLITFLSISPMNRCGMGKYVPTLLGIFVFYSIFQFLYIATKSLKICCIIIAIIIIFCLVSSSEKIGIPLISFLFILLALYILHKIFK